MGSLENDWEGDLANLRGRLDPLFRGRFFCTLMIIPQKLVKYKVNQFQFAHYNWCIKKLQAVLNNFYLALNAFYHTYFTIVIQLIIENICTCVQGILDRIICLLCVYICHYIFRFIIWTFTFFFFFFFPATLLSESK